MSPWNPSTEERITPALIDWTSLELANGQTAVNEIEDTPLYPAAVALAKQRVDWREAERRFLKDFPTRTGHARLFALAVRYLQVAG